MDYASSQRNAKKHLIGFTGVVLLHVFVIYALVTGMASKTLKVLVKPLETKIIEEYIPPPPLQKPEVVKIDIDPQSIVYWNGIPVNSRAELEGKIRAAAAQPVQPEVHLRPNKSAKYDVVASVMASAQRLGLTKIGIIGSEQFLE